MLRYFKRNGRTAPIDLGDLHYVSASVIERVCRNLGLDPNVVWSRPN